MMTPKAFGLTFNQFILLLFLLVVGIGYLFSNKDEEPIATQSLDEIQKKEVTTSPEPITSPFSEPLPLTSPTVVNKWGTLQSQEGKINLRSAPGTTNKAIGYGINGDRVQILDSARDSGGYPWYKVKFPESNAEGWIAEQLIVRSNSVTADKPNVTQEQVVKEPSKLQERVVEEAPRIPTGARCSDFSTQAQAQAALSANPQLDRDKDGVACESLR